MNKNKAFSTILFVASLPLIGWWMTGLLDLDEGFYGAIVSEMNRRGEWITPYFNGQPWFEKPILLYWIAKPCVALFGETLGPRLPSVLANVALYALVYWFVHKRFNAIAARISTLILGSSLLVLGAGRMMLTDPLLVLCFTGAMFTFWESLHGDKRMRLLTAACLGLGVLCKGPVACLLFVPIAGWTFYREKELRKEFSGQWLLGTVILALVVCSWYVPAYLANGQLFVQKFLIEQNIGRFTGGDQAHTLGGIGSLFLYIPILLLGMIPWPYALPAAWRLRTDSSTMRFLWAWAITVFLFFSISGAKLPHYILPCFPPLAILAGVRIAQVKPKMEQFAIGMCVFMAFFANAVFLVWYGLSGQREAHMLARVVRSQHPPMVVMYQIGRRNADRGTGKLKIQETSLPSMLFYLNSTATDAETLADLVKCPSGSMVFTREDRISDLDKAQLLKQGVQLQEVIRTRPAENYRLFLLKR